MKYEYNSKSHGGSKLSSQSSHFLGLHFAVTSVPIMYTTYTNFWPVGLLSSFFAWADTQTDKRDWK